ncbi:hypothetical protein AOQ84DRAFT_346502 [Glonium stellatum]|uniref:Uncharacterized protein n=1 Tax=Glonium stellatum TaxID=574774 RepID=A0A8E2ESR8_9PEZI|nr:hypothetical protein AOQ84DRAFT_346502 [Glonium stellatum]
MVALNLSGTTLKWKMLHSVKFRRASNYGPHMIYPQTHPHLVSSRHKPTLPRSAPPWKPLLTTPWNNYAMGWIYRAAVKLVGTMLDVDAKLNIGDKSQFPGYYSFGIKKSSGQVLLIFPDGTDFGVLNTHIAKAVEDVMERPSVRFEALARITMLRETIGRATRASDAVARVNINVYGSRDNSKDVGCRLSAHKVYLQRPEQQRPGSIYDNPHVLKLPEIQNSSLEYRLDDTKDTVSRSDRTDNFGKTISDLYASLKRGTRLKRVEGDNRLKTVLLPHQQEALDFMTQRETGPIPPEFCLWKPFESDGQQWYRHAVTNAKSRIQHPETGGGILADEMGMGKSLSILSLVTKTLEDAHNWAANRSASSTDGINSEKRLSRATLVVVSSALLINGWLKEMELHLNGTLKTVKYHGQKRETQIDVIEDSDIVITTYHTLAADVAAKNSPLNEIAWFRVVLDEAHIIRRQATTLYRTVYELSAKSRWCLTGTPIQNRLEDIGALFAFIRARPFDSMSTFRRYIAIPFDESDERRAIASRRLGSLIDSLCLRRTKDLLHLPERQERTRTLVFSKEERDQYEQTKRIMIRAIRQRAGEFDRKSMFGMFQAQLQLRILCNHGSFQHSFSWAKRSLLNEREDMLCSVGRNGEINCSSCRQSMPILGSNNVYRTYAKDCAHILCSECLDENEKEDEEGRDEPLKCPLCFPIAASLPETKVEYSNKEGRHDNYFRAEGHSTKMMALINDVKENLRESKSIIFSCWTRTLDLIAMYLQRNYIPYERIDGECPLPRRQKILDDFAKSLKTPVLIMTTGTGAFGLNLTSANRVFIVEPQWNPSVENQAIARALRLGQGKSVLVTRYVIERTVEQEMRSQQDRKLKIAEIGWG